jgi:hypothetical protein
MNKEFAKCLGCGALIAILAGEPVMPVLCKDCEHKKEYHINEPTYSTITLNTISSSMSSTLSGSPSPSPAPKEE